VFISANHAMASLQQLPTSALLLLDPARWQENWLKKGQYMLGADKR
jgi:hypothetical protein